jgi:hypothetical protein
MASKRNYKTRITKVVQTPNQLFMRVKVSSMVEGLIWLRKNQPTIYNYMLADQTQNGKFEAPSIDNFVFALNDSWGPYRVKLISIRGF